MIYLDYQATTPLAPEARAAMLPWLDGPAGQISNAPAGTANAATWSDGETDQGGYANPASPYRAGRAASVAVEMARDAVAALLPPGGQVYFTSGATEAINWIFYAQCAAPSSNRAASPPISATGLSIEHAATLQCLDRYAPGGGTLPVDAQGIALPVDPAALPPGGLTAISLVNNEIGTIQPVASFAQAAHASGGLLLCDAVQGFGRMTIPDGPDFIAVSAHKIHGPKGIGALWVRNGLTIPPLLVGGGQEMGMRSGTVSPALVAGFGAAATLAAQRMAADALHVRALWAMARTEMAGWTLNGSADQRYHGNLNLRREGVNATRLLSDARQIAFSLGSACGSGSGRSSHVLRAIGLSEAESRSSIRLGWGRYTREEDLRSGLLAIKQAAAVQGF